jgi:hypothetical protein
MSAVKARPVSGWSLAGLAFCLLVPSLSLIQKYLGNNGIFLYLLIALLSLALAISVLFRRLWRLLPEGQLLWVQLAVVAALILFVQFAYPAANSGRLGGGSDNDEALVIAATALVQGRYPYTELTYLGNRISPMPGAVILAIPFALLGNVALQNVFWMALYLWYAGNLLSDRRQSLLLVLTILVLSPIVPRGLAVGTDYIANSLYVLLLSLWTIRAAIDGDGGKWTTVLPAIFLGIGLSSRANFLLVVPLAFAAIAQQNRWQVAARQMAVVLLSFLTVTLPFYWYSPAEFSPIITYGELGQFDTVLPWAGVLIPTAAGIMALFLARQSNRTWRRYLGHVAVVQAIPVLAGALLATLRKGEITLGFLGFGVFFLFFGAAACWPDVMSASGVPSPARDRQSLSDSDHAVTGGQQHTLRRESGRG